METQPCQSPAEVNPTGLQSSDDPKKTPPSQDRISASAPELRFPRPQGSQHLANWVSNSLPELRQQSPPNMSDINSLADSAYEIIHGPDSESQDDRLTESTCSLSASRPDDVQSLDGSVDQLASMGSDEEEDQDADTANSPHASSIRYADQTLESPSTQLPPASDKEPLGPAPEWSDVGVAHPIEFDVADVIDNGITAQYILEEYSAEKATKLSRTLKLKDTSDHLGIVVRQSLANRPLSIQEPLRIFYAGRPEAQWRIIHKICRAIWASSSSKDAPGVQEGFGASLGKVYNIVPISSFGPSPELDLMEASPFQIVVESCISAEEFTPKEGSPEGKAVYSITTDHCKEYRSSESLDGPVIEPQWNLPHIAIIYSSQQDDDQDRRTARISGAVMKRHDVPSIFIADYVEPLEYGHLGEYIDTDTPHLSLESLDPERQMTPIRFPIDFDSFSKIDDRHLNRNLSFLTGLTEENNVERFGTTDKTKAKAQNENLMLILQNALMLMPAAMILTASIFLLAWVNSWKPLVHPVSPTSSTGVCSPPPAYPTGFPTIKASSVVTTTRTVVVNYTSTKTIQISQSKPTTSALASALSLAGLLSDGTSTVVPTVAEVKKPVNESKKTLCSVQVYGPRELLVAIPSRNKVVWLANGAIEIEVRRSDDTIKTKISSVDEGIIVELRPKDAYGKLNVSVITSRRPKINETFQVDMGKTVVSDAIEAGRRILQDALSKAPSREDLRRFVQEEVTATFHQAKEAVRHSQAGERVKRAAGTMREHLSRQIRAAETVGMQVGMQVDLSVLQAQIASRLWWLKMQGKMDEYAAYERNATRLLRLKYDELAHARGEERRGVAMKESRLGFANRLLSGNWKKRKGSRSEADGGPAVAAAGQGRSWRKFVGGV
ncbi:hypothetical protein VTJ04DRAFT_1166 [Mycothermus thermophilus]|uniref:uncharacterized protein n=1 Tax=Humicola insolens TaxID=85995 RepID=UPI0037445B02